MWNALVLYGEDGWDEHTGGVATTRGELAQMVDAILAVFFPDRVVL